MIYIIVIVALVVIALAGWIAAWRAGRPGLTPAKVMGMGKSKDINLDDIQDQAVEQLASSVQQATELFQKNLTVQALKINDELEGLAGRRLRQQVEDFNRVLDGLTTTATASVAQLESLVDQRRQALEASMSTQILDEKQRSLDHFYARLSDVVSSYVIQSLGNEVDVSGQLPFVIKVLEDNKDSIKRDLTGEY